MVSDVKFAHEWVLIYYMSYDNNLQHCEPVILNALDQGVKNTDLVVTVLADDSDQGGLKRYTITTDDRKVETLDTENSASEEVLSDYLAWAATTYPAKHYVITFLDHGGCLDEMCLDTWPGKDSTKIWLNARLVGTVIKKFRNQIDGEVDLLFFQQCGRSSIENLYNFRDGAQFILASQMVVGAPNTYYKRFLQWLATAQTPTGLDVAKKIMSFDYHFTIYTCIDGAFLRFLPSKLAPVIKELTENIPVPLPTPQSPIPCFHADKEDNYDVLQWFHAAFQENKIWLDALDQFSLWLRNSLIKAMRVHPDADPSVGQLCGISMFVPNSLEAIEIYKDHPFYEESFFMQLWNAMYSDH